MLEILLHYMNYDTPTHGCVGISNLGITVVGQPDAGDDVGNAVIIG